MEKPDQVLNLERRLKDKKIWFITTSNEDDQSVTTCWDAAGKRNRLGHSSIPLFCELKTCFGFFIENSEKKYVMIHCRGNQQLDYDKIKKIIGAKIERIEENELKNVFDAEHGLVNPFLVFDESLGFEESEVLQIFDESIVTQDFIPNTMMTNASHFKWGIEFKPYELIEALPNKIITDVVREDTKFTIKKHKIGILTGNSPESGILLWEKINEAVRGKLDKYLLGDISLPDVIIESNPEMGLSMELDLRFDDVKKVVEKGITNLCERGATIVCIACNTTQYFSEMAKEICSRHKAIYVSISETTYQRLKGEKTKEFDFLGINYVSDFEKWSDFKDLNRDFDLYLPNERDINKLAFKIKDKVISNDVKGEFFPLINNFTKTNNIILALTEFSIVFSKLDEKSREKKLRKGEEPTKVYDSLTLLAEAIGDMCTRDYLSEIEKNIKMREDMKLERTKHSSTNGVPNLL